MKRKLFHIAGALALVLAGCASVPEAPEEFETTGSLAGTGWSGMQGEAIETLLNINDAESGVFISMEGEELPFTYTAVYDAEKKSFTGTLTPEGGAEGAFSVIKGRRWKITAEGLGLDDLSFQYLSADALQNRIAELTRAKERVQRYGPLFTRSKAGDSQFNGDNGQSLVFQENGNFNIATGLSITKMLTASLWELHSKDGVTITMLKKSRVGLSSVSEPPSGTFKVSMSMRDGHRVMTIFGGTGDGAQFNGVWWSFSVQAKLGE